MRERLGAQSSEYEGYTRAAIDDGGKGYEREREREREGAQAKGKGMRERFGTHAEYIRERLLTQG